MRDSILGVNGFKTRRQIFNTKLCATVSNAAEKSTKLGLDYFSVVKTERAMSLYSIMRVPKVNWFVTVKRLTDVVRDWFSHNFHDKAMISRKRALSE